MIERVAQLVEIRHFDFGLPGAAFGKLRGLERRRDSARHSDMIFLDQDGFRRCGPHIFPERAARAEFFPVLASDLRYR